LFHSGLPHRGINSLELVSEAMAVIQRRFYEDFPPHEQEQLYKFATPSTMKPTQVECAKGALNQLPPWTTISGDIRLTPFYDPITVMNKVNEYVAELNENMEGIPTRGPCSKYTLQAGDDVDITRGTLEMKWGDDVAGILQMEGIACDLKSPGLQALIDATAEVKGEAKPYAITGSLPLVKQMQKQGFDIQITG
jgi:acetylornithine deacetylase